MRDPKMSFKSLLFKGNSSEKLFWFCLCVLILVFSSYAIESYFRSLNATYHFQMLGQKEYGVIRAAEGLVILGWIASIIVTMEKMNISISRIGNSEPIKWNTLPFSRKSYYESRYDIQRSIRVGRRGDGFPIYFLELERGDILCLAGRYLSRYEIPLRENSLMLSSFPSHSITVRRSRNNSYVIYMKCSGKSVSSEYQPHSWSDGEYESMIKYDGIEFDAVGFDEIRLDWTRILKT